MKNPDVGRLIKADEEPKRDAIHVAVVPCIATEPLKPGEFVSVTKGSNEAFANAINPVGIVDPFLTEPVELDQRFWLFILPNTVTSLRHAWTHPMFRDDDKYTNESEEWIEKFAESIKMSYEQIMAAADRWNVGNWDYTYDNTENYKDKNLHDWEEFWNHWQVVTGKMPKDRSCFFTCSC